MSDNRKPIKRALVSVYDKTGLEELAKGLHAAGVEIVSTGSTAGRIKDAGVPVTAVDELTGFPECLEGRVKTLHPRVHAGILADTRKPEHLEQLKELEVDLFQLVVVNLYPFAETVASGADFDACVEQIDIGGPSMVRAAAKNHPSVAVVTDPARYDAVLKALDEGGFSLQERTELAAEAFQHTASYDVAVATWFAEQLGERAAAASDDEDVKREAEFPVWKGATGRETCCATVKTPQSAALCLDNAHPGMLKLNSCVSRVSYNNYMDADAAASYDHEQLCGRYPTANLRHRHLKRSWQTLPGTRLRPVSAFGHHRLNVIFLRDGKRVQGFHQASSPPPMRTIVEFSPRRRTCILLRRLRIPLITARSAVVSSSWSETA